MSPQAPENLVLVGLFALCAKIHAEKAWRENSAVLAAPPSYSSSLIAASGAYVNGVWGLPFLVICLPKVLGLCASTAQVMPTTRCRCPLLCLTRCHLAKRRAIQIRRLFRQSQAQPSLAPCPSRMRRLFRRTVSHRCFPMSPGRPLAGRPRAWRTSWKSPLGGHVHAHHDRCTATSWKCATELDPMGLVGWQQRGLRHVARRPLTCPPHSTSWP